MIFGHRIPQEQQPFRRSKSKTIIDILTKKLLTKPKILELLFAEGHVDLNQFGGSRRGARDARWSKIPFSCSFFFGKKIGQIAGWHPCASGKSSNPASDADCATDKDSHSQIPHILTDNLTLARLCWN